mgnify:CR=1 FL=1
MSIEQSRQSDLIAYDPTLAYFSKIDAEPVLISPENQHFTIYNPAQMRQEIVRQGSGDIVAMLHLFELNPQRELAFFDINGTFFDRLVLDGLHEHTKHNGNKAIKHDAVFSSGYTSQSFSIPIDKIYSLSGSYRTENDLANPLYSGDEQPEL